MGERDDNPLASTNARLGGETSPSADDLRKKADELDAAVGNR